MRASILTSLSGASAKEAIIGSLLLAGIFCVFWSPILLLLFFKGAKRERFAAFAIIALIVLVCVGGALGPAPLRIPWRIVSQVLVAPAVIAFILFGSVAACVTPREGDKSESVMVGLLLAVALFCIAGALSNAGIAIERIPWKLCGLNGLRAVGWAALSAPCLLMLALVLMSRYPSLPKWLCLISLLSHLVLAQLSTFRDHEPYMFLWSSFINRIF
jgi:hypothetical protein